MTEIPAGRYTFVNGRHGRPQSRHTVPGPLERRVDVMMPRYFIDTYPVTNLHYREFLAAHALCPERHGELPASLGERRTPERAGNPPGCLGEPRGRPRVCTLGGEAPPERHGMAIRRRRGRTEGSTPGGSIRFHQVQLRPGPHDPCRCLPAGKSPFGVMDWWGTSGS